MIFWGCCTLLAPLSLSRSLCVSLSFPLILKLVIQKAHTHAYWIRAQYIFITFLFNIFCFVYLAIFFLPQQRVNGHFWLFFVWSLDIAQFFLVTTFCVPLLSPRRVYFSLSASLCGSFALPHLNCACISLSLVGWQTTSLAFAARAVPARSWRE